MRDNDTEIISTNKCLPSMKMN